MTVHRQILAIVTLMLLSACPDGPTGRTSDRSFVAPADGQTMVSLDNPLIIQTVGFDFPDEYPLPSRLIQVFDVEDDAPVKGAISRDGARITFVPKDGLQPDRQYAWSLIAQTPTPRTPELRIDKDLFGSGIFSTSDQLQVLEAVLGETDGEICLLLSQPAGATDDVRVTLDDWVQEESLWEPLTREEWGKPYELADGDAGLAAACVSGLDPTRTLVGTSVRVWWNEDGPWQFELDRLQLDRLASERRRGNF